MSTDKKFLPFKENTNFYGVTSIWSKTGKKEVIAWVKEHDQLKFVGGKLITTTKWSDDPYRMYAYKNMAKDITKMLEVNRVQEK